MKEDLEDWQGRVERFQFVTWFSRINKVDAYVKNTLAGTRERQGELLRPLMTKVPVDDTKKDPVGRDFVKAGPSLCGD